MLPSFDSEAAAIAAEELDGNRPRRANPLTIIQMKNPAKNLDSDSPCRISLVHKKCCVVAVSGLAVCLIAIGFLSWSMNPSCSDPFQCPQSWANFMGASYLMSSQQPQPWRPFWTKDFKNLGKRLTFYIHGLLWVTIPKDAKAGMSKVRSAGQMRPLIKF